MRTAQGATLLRMAGVVDLAYWANIPLTVDMDVPKVMTFETRLAVTRVVMREGGIDRYAVNGSSSIDLVTELGVLEG